LSWHSIGRRQTKGNGKGDERERILLFSGLDAGGGKKAWSAAGLWAADGWV
jgi:hypothetical protein